MKDYKRLRKPIIFIGCGRTGTTIISEIVMRHKNLAFPSNYQSLFPKQPYVNLIRLIFDNPLWRIVGQKKQLNKVFFLNKFFFNPDEAYPMWDHITGKDTDFSRSFLHNKVATKKDIKCIRNYFNQLVKLQGKKRLALKITGPSRIKYIQSIFPDAQFIYLQRDKIATIHSFLKVDFWKSRGMKQLWWKGAYTEEEEIWAEQNKHTPLAITALQVKKLVDISKQELSNAPHISINYEAFVENPALEILKILEFTKLNDYYFECINYLNKVNIINRNKLPQEYFSGYELEFIYKIFANKLPSIKKEKNDADSMNENLDNNYAVTYNQHELILNF